MAKRFAIGILSTALLSAMAVGQSTPASQPQAAGQSNGSQTTSGSTRIAPGSVIPVQLTKTIDAKKAKQGDQVTAKVTQDLKGSSGEVIVPKNTTVVGHVTEVQARNKEQKESELGIAFDRTEAKSGSMQMPMSIQAIIVPPSNNAGASDQGAPPQPSSSPMSPGAGGGRNPMGGGGTSSAPQPQGNNLPTGDSGTPSGASGMPAINGNTQGVIGIPNLKLETNPQNSAQGSVLTSEKNNVKLESGTFLLLRVNQ